MGEIVSKKWQQPVNIINFAGTLQEPWETKIGWGPFMF